MVITTEFSFRVFLKQNLLIGQPNWKIDVP